MKNHIIKTISICLLFAILINISPRNIYADSEYKSNPGGNQIIEIINTLNEEGLNITINDLDKNKLSQKEKEIYNNIKSENYWTSDLSNVDSIILSEVEKVAVAKLVARDLIEIENENRDNLSLLKENDYTLERLFRTNRSQAENIKATYDSLMRDPNSMGIAAGYRITIFVELVKTGGEWDLKTNPLNPTWSYLWRSQNRTGEYIGNYHYGYMGRVIGLGTFTLQSAAGLYQVYGRNFQYSWVTTYFDDPRDREAIDHGMSEYTIRF